MPKIIKKGTAKQEVSETKKKAKAVEPEEEKEEVDQEEEKMIDTDPESFSYRVKVDSKKYEGRAPEQVFNIVAGVLGAVKKIVIEKM